MALLHIFFAAASCVFAAMSEAAVGTSGLPEEHIVQIDVTGSVRAAAHAGANAHHSVQAVEDNSERLMRQEVRPHIQEAPEKADFAQLDDLNCPVAQSVDHDSVIRKLCKILEGSNTQVAGKLERAVKGLSLRPKSANETQFVVADKVEEKQLVKLKAALWDLWFCAKKTDPPCDPLTSDDHKVALARTEAFASLEAINNHPEAGLSTTLSPGDSPGSDRIDHMAGGSVMPVPEEAVASQSPTGWSSSRFHRAEGMPSAEAASSLLEAESSKETPVGEDSKFAEDVLGNLLKGNDKEKIQLRLWNAINKMDVQKVLEDDIVKIEDDADGNYKALKANLLLLHECATMPECPATNCCSPKSPTQTVYKDARDAAYEAYHNIQHDTDLAKQTYLDLLSTVADGQHKDYYPPSHPLYHAKAKETTTEESVDTTINPNATEEKPPAPPVEEGSMLMIAICVVTAVVILGIGFLVNKTSKMDTGDKGGAGGGGAENWGGEGEYGAENFGNY